MTANNPKDPLHGITLKAMLETLVERHGWQGLGDRIDLRCFANDPSISSSLKFLRKTDWARAKLEKLYLSDLQKIERNRKRNRRRADQRAYRARQEAEGAEGEEADGQLGQDEEPENAASRPGSEQGETPVED